MHAGPLAAVKHDHELNRRTYSSPDVVLSFALRRTLQAPEARICEILAPRLPHMTMLDVGVGGGRTTHHFLPRVREYLAVDYSARMIWACRRNFPHKSDAFQVADARAMPEFADGRFDFVLYSYNGIDYMGHEDRLRALAEIRRILRPGGVFCFSSHNLQSVRSGGWPRFSWKLLEYLGRLKFWLFLRLFNRRALSEQLHHAPYLVLRDLPRALTYYATPAEQLRQLHEAGFRSVRIFGLHSGAELADLEAAERTVDPWLYYLCEAP